MSRRNPKGKSLPLHLGMEEILRQMSQEIAVLANELASTKMEVATVTAFIEGTCPGALAAMRQGLIASTALAQGLVRVAGCSSRGKEDVVTPPFEGAEVFV